MTSHSKESFGELIRRVRCEKQLTLTQLAAKLDMDSANLSKVETGKREFDEKRIQMLADALNVNELELRKEYLSDFVAKKLYLSNEYEDVLELAENKIKYFRQNNTKQEKLNIT